MIEETTERGWTVRAWRRGSSWRWSATDQGGTERVTGGYEPSRRAALVRARDAAARWRAPSWRLQIVRCYGCRLLELADRDARCSAAHAGRQLQRHNLDARAALARLAGWGPALDGVRHHLRLAAESDGTNGAEWRPL